MTPSLSLIMFVDSYVLYDIGDIVEIDGRRGQVVDCYFAPHSLLVWWHAESAQERAREWACDGVA